MIQYLRRGPAVTPLSAAAVAAALPLAVATDSLPAALLQAAMAAVDAAGAGDAAEFGETVAEQISLEVRQVVSKLAGLLEVPASMLSQQAEPCMHSNPRVPLAVLLAHPCCVQVFSVYECRSAAAQHGKAHPGDIAEPASLAAIPLPPRWVV